MDSSLKRQVDPPAHLWDTVIAEVFQPLGIFHAPMLQTREAEGDATFLWAVGVKAETSARAEISQPICTHKEYIHIVITHIQRKQLAALLKLRRFFQLSLPAEPRKQSYLAEGDYLEPEAVEEGILLKPIRVVEQKNAWDMSDERLRHDWRGVFVLCLSETIL